MAYSTWSNLSLLLSSIKASASSRILYIALIIIITYLFGLTLHGKDVFLQYSEVLGGHLLDTVHVAQKPYLSAFLEFPYSAVFLP